MLAQQSVSGSANVSSAELRDLKLKLARKENEFKELKAQLEEIKKNGVTKEADSEEIQNERDQLIMKNEALQELLTKNNITMPSNTTKGHESGGKRT